MVLIDGSDMSVGPIGDPPTRLMATGTDSEFVEFTARSHGSQIHPLAHQNMVHPLAHVNIIPQMVQQTRSI